MASRWPRSWQGPSSSGSLSGYQAAQGAEESGKLNIPLEGTPKGFAITFWTEGVCCGLRGGSGQCPSLAKHPSSALRRHPATPHDVQRCRDPNTPNAVFQLHLRAHSFQAWLQPASFLVPVQTLPCLICWPGRHPGAGPARLWHPQCPLPHPGSESGNLPLATLVRGCTPCMVSWMAVFLLDCLHVGPLGDCIDTCRTRSTPS